MPDWLVIAQEQWDQVERRNQLLVRALAQRNPHTRFLFAEQPLRARHLRTWRWPGVAQVAPNIWTFRPIRPFPGTRLQAMSDRVECLQLRHVVRRLGIDRPVVWTQDPRAATLLDNLPAGRLVYDLTDDWPAFESDPARRAAVQDRVERLAGRAELVLACSRPLAQGARAWNAHVHYLPNAVEPPGADEATPADLAELARPRLGYVGTLHSSRLDVELLARAAELRPEWSYVLLGPDELEPGDRERLLALPNVHHLGVRPHGEIQSYLTGIDVCLLAHLITEFTRSLDPLKLYEYLAAGRPVIATPVGNTEDLQDHIAIAATAEELVHEAERAMAHDSPARVAARRGAVAGDTWEARAVEIETKLAVPSAASRDHEVCAVIVSHNTRDLLARCLAAVLAQSDVDLHVIVVDNASTDGSVRMVRESFPEVELVALEDNLGFGSANNVAFGRSRSEFVLLVNSDAFLAPGALSSLVDVARARPNAGAVGPRLHNPDGTLQRSAWPFPHAGRLLLEAFALHRPLRRLGVLEDLGLWAHDDERAVDFLVGACLLLRTDALIEVGGFDEGFWLYGEEADLQRRLATRGWHVVFTPTGAVTHIGGASSQTSLGRLRQFYGGQKRFLDKHGTVISWPVARFALLIGSLARGRWLAVRVAAEREPACGPGGPRLV